MKSIAFKLILSATVLSWSAEKVCSSNFELINLPETFKLSSAKILETQMDQKNSRQLILPTSDSISSEKSLESNMAWAKSEGCTYLHIGSLTRLGEMVQVSSKTYSLASGEVVHKNAYNAEDPNDLSPIMSQIANALSDDKFETTQSIYDVSRADSKALRKKRSTSHYSASVGYLGFLSPQVSSAFGVGGSITWDVRTFIAEIDMSLYNFTPKEGLGVTSVSINLFKPFGDEDKAFYLGGGAGLGLFSYTNDCGTSYQSSYDYQCEEPKVDGALLLHANAGYLVGRTSDINFRIQGDLKVGVTTIKGEVPLGLGVKFILGFQD